MTALRASAAGFARRARFVLPTMLLILFGYQKLAFDPVPINERRGDGAFYIQIAQHVAAGDVLARLDGDLPRIEMQQARANLDKVSSEYRRLVGLHELMVP